MKYIIPTIKLSLKQLKVIFPAFTKFITFVILFVLAGYYSTPFFWLCFFIFALLVAIALKIVINYYFVKDSVDKSHDL